MDIEDNKMAKANDLAYRMAMESMKYEKDREQSAYTSSGYMITSVSILTVTFVTIVPILLSKFESVSNYIFLCLAIILILLFISLYFTLRVQDRHKYNTFPSPIEIHKHITDNIDWFSSEMGMGTYLETYDVIFKQLKCNNDTRITNLKYSQFFLKLSIGMSFVFLLIGIIKSI